MACGASKPITRDFGARYEQGRVVPGDAYAAALRGAIAEASGDHRLAKREYDRASDLFPDDPELSTRSAAASCALKPDATALEDVTRAHENYVPAWVALARCYERMGEPGRARGAKTKAASLAPGSEGTTIDAFAEATFLRDSGASYFAAAVQAGAAGDGPLEVWAYARAADLSMVRRADVARVASDFVLAGRWIDARVLAVRLVELGMRGGAPLRVPSSLGKLAVDAALLDNDAGAAMARAHALRIPLAEVALRAFVLGRRGLSRSLFSLVLATEPESGDARLAATLDGEGTLGDAPSLSRFGRLVLSAEVLRSGVDADVAANVLGERKPDVEDVEDPLVRKLLVTLAMAGALRPTQAMLDVRVEANLRAGKEPPEGLLHSPSLDRVRSVARGGKAEFRSAEVSQEPLAAFAWCKQQSAGDRERLRQVAALHSRDPLVTSTCK